MKKFLAVLGLGVLGTTMTAAMSGAVEAPKPQIVKMEEGRTVPFPGHLMHSVVSGAELPADVSVMELTVPPKSIGAPPHIHADEDEVFIILEGGLTFLNGKETVSATKGSAAILPRGHWHGLWNPHDEPAKLLLVIAPAAFEGFFDDVVMKVRAENPGSPQEVGAIIAQTAAARNVIVDPTRFPPEALALMPK